MKSLILLVIVFYFSFSNGMTPDNMKRSKNAFHPHHPKRSSVRQQCDPADSWLAYAVSSGNGNMVTQVNASWVVPSLPTDQSEGSAPGWWFGIEPSPACFLIQPILAWGYTGEAYSIFNGYYQWDDSDWWSSTTGNVNPGQHINAWVQYLESNNSYNMFIGCEETGFSVLSNIGVVESQVYTDTYFVVEHQPSSCSQYPSNGELTFSDIAIALKGKYITPSWKTVQWQDACNCTGIVNSPSSLTFTWSTQ